MTCKRAYHCDLCRDPIYEPTDGIGIRWNSGNKINHIFLADAEHHLCNRCLTALREMFADIDRTTEMYRHLDALGEQQ